MIGPKISVIMPVLLKPRPGITHNPEKKFLRAVSSFLAAVSYYPNAELIIISDGCSITNRLVAQNFKHVLGGHIKLFKLPPRPDGSVFIGSTRQYGINKAEGLILCNLDADDYFLPHHLNTIATSFNIYKYDWCYFNCHRKLDNLKNVEELVEVEPEINKLFTTCVAWKKITHTAGLTWDNCNGKQDNKFFNKQLLSYHSQKIYGAGYVIAHANFNIL